MVATMRMVMVNMAMYDNIVDNLHIDNFSVLEKEVQFLTKKNETVNSITRKVIFQLTGNIVIVEIIEFFKTKIIIYLCPNLNTPCPEICN